jgi:WD40 repeat protein
MYTITADTPPSTPATFSATGSLKTARSNPAVTLLQNGQVLVTGGQSSTGSILASAELYDPNTGVFTLTTGPMNAARWVHTANLLPNGQVLITGGQSNTNPATLASAELYNPATGTFSYTTGPMTTPRSNQTATLLPNGQVLIAGGNTSSNDMSVGPSAELYNPSTGSFTATGSMGTDRYVANAALLPNGQVLIVGGISIPANTYLSSAELYDPATGAFTSTGSMNSKRGYFTATLLQNGQVLAAGGGNPGQLTTAELYNAGTFSTTGPMSNQQGGPATLLADGQVLFAGGYNTPTSTYLTTSELYNAGSFSLTGPMITARNGAAATLLYDGQVLVVGGANSSGVLGSAELYAPPN